MDSRSFTELGAKGDGPTWPDQAAANVSYVHMKI